MAAAAAALGTAATKAKQAAAAPARSRTAPTRRTSFLHLRLSTNESVIVTCNVALPWHTFINDTSVSASGSTDSKWVTEGCDPSLVCYMLLMP